MRAAQGSGFCHGSLASWMRLLCVCVVLGFWGFVKGIHRPADMDML